MERWFPDSDFIRKGAYRYRFEIDPETGERIWLPLTEQEMEDIGTFADVQIQKEIDAYEELWVSEKFKDQVPGAPVGLPFTTQEKNITARTATIGDVRGPAFGRDTKGDGSIMLLLATPEGFGPALRGRHLIGDLNINLVVRIQPGSYFRATKRLFSRELLHTTRLLHTTPTAFTTDLGVQKSFQIGGFRPQVFFEATNLFNAKKPKVINRFSFFDDIPNYGLAENQPTPEEQRASNTVWDPWTAYQNRAREVFFGGVFSQDFPLFKWLSIVQIRNGLAHLSGAFVELHR